MGKTLDRALTYYLRTAFWVTPVADESDINVVEGANIRPVRVGCILSKEHKRKRKFLLGRLQEHDGTPHQYQLKTAGGYINFLSDGELSADINVYDALLRELKEEGFRRQYSPHKNSFRPVGVFLSPTKGILQFFRGQLNRYPEMGVSAEAFFRRRKDHDVRIQYCTLEQVIKAAIADKSIPFETSRAIAASYLFEPSRRVDVRKTLAHGLADDNGNIHVPDSVAVDLVVQAGLKDYPFSALESCEVYFARPILSTVSNPVESVDIQKIIAPLQAFFVCGPFMRQIDFYAEDIGRLVGTNTKTVDASPVKVIGKFLNRYFDKLMLEEFLKPYLKGEYPY